MLQGTLSDLCHVKKKGEHLQSNLGYHTAERDHPAPPSIWSQCSGLQLWEIEESDNSFQAGTGSRLFVCLCVEGEQSRIIKTFLTHCRLWEMWCECVILPPESRRFHTFTLKVKETKRICNAGSQRKHWLMATAAVHTDMSKDALSSPASVICCLNQIQGR